MDEEKKTPVVEDEDTEEASDDEEEESEVIPTPPDPMDSFPDSDEIGKYGYRYLCPACSGNAYYTGAVPKVHPQTNCNSCRTPLHDFHVGNFVPLTEEERERFTLNER